MSVILDASALLAFLKSEPGADIVQKHLRQSCISTVNLLEVLEKSLRPQRKVDQVVRLLHGWEVEVIPFDERQMHVGVSIKEQVGKADVSLADRACLALAVTRGSPVLTADRLWKTLGLSVEILLIREANH